MKSINEEELRTLYMDTLEEIEFCPYCGTEYGRSISCCGEVHFEAGYKNPEGDLIPEEELEDFFQYYLKKEKQK